MPTNREEYFKAKELGVPETVINFALQEANSFTHLELTKHFDDEISNQEQFESSVNRYLNGEMIEYIFNKAYFLGQPYYVSKDVLIPRQETEQLVIETKALIEEMFPNCDIDIADVCTGSGVVGVSLKSELPNSRFVFADISKDAIRVAKINAKGLNNCLFCVGDMLQPLIESKIKLDVIVCNPPYIETEETIDKRTLEQEPLLALLAKPNTKYYEEIFKNAYLVLKEKYLMAFEIGEDMKESLTKLVNAYLPNDEFFFKEDTYGKTRFLFIKHQ